MEEQNVTIPTTRVRMNFTTTAKGLAQLDITAEAPTVEETSKLMSEAVPALRKILDENGIKEAGRE